VYLVNSAAGVACLSVYVRHLTDLTVAGFSDVETAVSWDADTWGEHLDKYMASSSFPIAYLATLSLDSILAVLAGFGDGPRDLSTSRHQRFPQLFPGKPDDHR